MRCASVLVAAVMLAISTPAAASADLGPGTRSADYSGSPAFSDDAAFVVPGHSGVRTAVGAAAVSEADDGAPIPDAIPPVTGQVVAATGDGAGGWFLGGTFTHVGGIRRRNIAHVMPDGSVDPAFDPGGPATVVALARHGGRLYVSSSFPDRIPGRPILQALDVGTGAPLASWQPPALGLVTSMQAAGDSLYVSGELVRSSADGHSTTLLELDPDTGLRRAWQPPIADVPSAIAVLDDVVVVGGGGLRLKGALDTRYGVLAVDRTSGVARWSSTVSDEGFDQVHDLAAAGDDVVVGGDFSAVGGAERHGVALLDGLTGALSPWRVDVVGDVHALAVRGRSVHVVGELSRVGGLPRRGGAAVSLDDGAVGPWNPGTGGWRQTVAVQGDRVLAGGLFVGAGPRREGLGEILRVLPDGTLDTDWVGPTFEHGPWDGVSDTVVLGDTLFVAGWSFEADGRPKTNLAAVDLRTGDVRDWSTTVTGRITTITAAGDRLIVAGSLRVPGMLPDARSHRLLSIDPATGTPDEWFPEPDDDVYALTVHRDRLYVGGTFRRIAGQRRVGGASFALPDLALGSWDPAAPQIRAIAAFGDLVAIGGGFSDVGPRSRDRLAIVDAGTGAPTAWEPPHSLGSIATLTFDGRTVVAAGDFSRVDDRRRNGLVALDAETAEVLPWDTNLTGATHDTSVALQGSRLWVTGAFNGLGRNSRGGLAVVETAGGMPGAGDDTPPTIVVASPVQGARYPSESEVPRTFTCADETGGSGLADCRAEDELRIDSDGTRSFRVRAYDRDGNVGFREVRFTIGPPPNVPIPDPPGTTPTEPTAPAGPTPTTPSAPPTTDPTPPSTTDPAPPGPPDPAPPKGPARPASPAEPVPWWVALLGTPAPPGPATTPPDPVDRAVPTASPDPAPTAAPTAQLALRVARSARLGPLGRGRATRAVVTATAPAATRLTIRLTVVIGGRAVTVARGSGTSTASDRLRVTVRATATGRRLLRAARPTTVHVTIITPDNTTVVRRETLDRR